MSQQFFFSPHILDNWPAPSTGFDVVQDTAEPRLRMYITSRGVKSFFVRKRANGRDVRVIIGKYPELDISDARQRVDDTLKSVMEKPKKHRKKTGFRKISDLYLIKKVRRCEDSRVKLIRAMTRHISPLFDKNVQDITTADISSVLDSIGGVAIRNRMYESLSSIFNFALDGGYVKSNPVAKITKVREIRRVRPLTESGLNRLIVAINKEPDQNLRTAFFMLIYGFAPRSKIFTMKWRDLDFNQYMWNDYPLSDAAAVLLQNLPQDGRWVFSGRGGNHLTDPRAGWRKIAVAARVPNLTMDDVHKFMMRKLVWVADREQLRENMNKVLAV